jgi:hypothetical protein
MDSRGACFSCGVPRLRKHKELGYHYKFFGLNFHSNLSLPWTPIEKNTEEKWDVALHLGVSLDAESKNMPVSEELMYVSSDTNEKGVPVLQIWKDKSGTLVRMAFEDGTQFWLDHGRENIWASWPDHLPLENTTSYLLGPVLGLMLRLRGNTCLHASAVNYEGRCIAFLGPAGAGKSTTAAAFARDGHAVLSDDIAALVEREGTFQVLSAYPHLCLWPDSVSMLYGSPDALPLLSTNWEKRRLALGKGGTLFESRPLPLGAIYLLGERRSDRAPCAEAVRPQAALLALVAETYANKILDREMRAREFELLSRLVTQVPVRRVCAHTDAGRLRHLCQIIGEDYHSLNLPTAART